MEPSTLSSNMALPRIVPTVPSGLSSFAIDGTKFSFYLLGVAGFVVIVISGLVLVRTRYALNAIFKENSLMPNSEDRKPVIHTNRDTERALNKQDVEATAVMRRARSFAIFGPLPSVLTMIAVPVSLHLNSVGDIGVRVLLSLLLITIIHCANACTLQTYFSLIEKETRVCFGSEVCPARDEIMRSGYLKIYLTLLFALSFVKTNTKNEHADATNGWEPAATYAPFPFTLARLSEDLSDMESITGGELQRLV
jgi:hypothetical protein